MLQFPPKNRKGNLINGEKQKIENQTVIKVDPPSVRSM